MAPLPLSVYGLDVLLKLTYTGWSMSVTTTLVLVPESVNVTGEVPSM